MHVHVVDVVLLSIVTVKGKITTFVVFTYVSLSDIEHSGHKAAIDSEVCASMLNIKYSWPPINLDFLS